MKIKYVVILKAREDRSEAELLSGEKNRLDVLFDTLEEAQNACIQHNGYEVTDNYLCAPVWKNPYYQSKYIKDLRKYLGKILLPH